MRESIVAVQLAPVASSLVILSWVLLGMYPQGGWKKHLVMVVVVVVVAVVVDVPSLIVQPSQSWK